MNDIVAIPDDPGAVAAEIAVIEKQMGTSAYIRDEGKQQRYRALVRKREGYSSILPQSGPRQNFSHAAPMPIASRAQYQAENGTTQGYDSYTTAMRTAADVMTRLPAHEMALLEKSFEDLPDDVSQAAVFELASKAPPRAPVVNSDLETFASTPWGSALIQEWGSEAIDRLGTLRARLLRALMKLDEDGQLDLNVWLDNLSDAAAMAVFRRMSL